MERFVAEVTCDSHAQHFLQKREEGQLEFLCAWFQHTEQPPLGKRRKGREACSVTRREGPELEMQGIRESWMEMYRNGGGEM